MIPVTSVHALRDFVVILLILFEMKHFIFDFLYQPPYQYLNKGTFGHLGGILHSLQHAIPTFLILYGYCGLGASFSFGLAILEFILHYLIDFAKININRIMQWGPTTSENFWRFLGLDQLMHQLTYAFLIFVVLT